jgi:flagellar basal body rod protein FlgC
MLGGMLFAVPQTVSASLREDYPRYRLRVGTNNIANMLSTWTKAITSYDSSKYDAAANKFTTDIF